MLANIRQHAAYIASTIGYIDDQIAEDTRIVTEASVSFFYILCPSQMCTFDCFHTVLMIFCIIPVHLIYFCENFSIVLFCLMLCNQWSNIIVSILNSRSLY